MRFPTRTNRTTRGPLALILALTVGPLAATGLENGEVYANSQFSIGGTTSSAIQVLNMAALAPDPFAMPPLPPSFAPARAIISGPMTPIQLETSASITSAFNQFSSQATSLVEFVDSLVVNAEGIAPGTDLIVEVTWEVSGTAETNGADRITKRSKLLVQAEGVDLDPDPDAPPPPKQTWTRDVSNFQPEVLDEFGTVSFEFLVQAGTAPLPPEPGNIRLRMVAGVLVGGPGSLFTGGYDSDVAGDLTVTFVGATNVKTTTGQTLYRWDTSAHSELDYGFRDEDPPVIPEVTLSPSDGGPLFIKLSWFSDATKYYIVEATTDNSTWQPVTEVLGTGNQVSIDLIKDQLIVAYRLIVNTGAGSPNPALRKPLMRLMKIGATVRIAWLANHWEIYQLSEVEASGNLRPLHAHLGDGSTVWFDFTPTSPGQIFQISAILKP